MPPDRIRLRRLAALLAVLAVAALGAGLVVAAGREDDEDGSPSVPEAGRASPEEQVSFLARIVPPPAERERAPAGPAVPRSVTDLARRLPLERKVAQLFLFGFRGTDTSAEVFGRLRRLDLGGIVLARPNYLDAGQLGALAGEAAALARAARHVPPWVLASQQGGALNSFPDLPPALAPADLRSAEEAGAQALDSAAALRGLGVTGVLGPVLDVGVESGSALGARVYSDDPAEVAGYADATVKAYRRKRVFSAVSHFPGLGAADQSTEVGPATVGLGLAELRERDLQPFAAAFESGVPGVVLSHALYPMSDFTVPGSLSRRVATDLLRDELGFEGVALTDDLADPAVTRLSTVPDAAVAALRAGADMLFISGSPGDQQAAYVAVLRAVRSGRVPRARLNQAIGRILVAKENYGLIR
ncbi:MAG TPA: glycoside hydrolase family 3 N-terminal domain-containing protein [Thermoleophilaceae bacterium]|nr:glycoside hydrolase family 3 N-terminal domain-containing protein [Thermoleophilaceae bacterium]